MAANLYAPQLSPFPTSGTIAQQQQQNVAPSVPLVQTVPSAESQSPLKNLTPVALCRIGQETVTEITQKITDMFLILRQLQLPNGFMAVQQQLQDKKMKFEDHIRRIEQLFKKLRYIYNAICEETANIETKPVEELLPIGDCEIEFEENRNSDSSKSDEERELIEQIQQRNRQLKETIDQMRIIIYLGNKRDDGHAKDVAVMCRRRSSLYIIK